MTEKRLMKNTDKVELTSGGVTTLHSHPGGGAGPAEKGITTSGADGTVTVNFTGSYATKPTVALTPELAHGEDTVTVQIETWVMDNSNYIGVTIFCGDDGGKPEVGVPIHWLIWA